MAGPKEQQLERIAKSSLDEVRAHSAVWTKAAEEIQEVARKLRLQATRISSGGTSPSPTMMAAAAVFRAKADELELRHNEITNIAAGLDSACAASESTATRISRLPDANEPRPMLGGAPLSAEEIQATWDARKAAREQKAAEELEELREEYADAAARMGHVNPSPDDYTSEQGTTGRGPLSGGGRGGSSLQGHSSTGLPHFLNGTGETPHGGIDPIEHGSVEGELSGGPGLVPSPGSGPSPVPTSSPSGPGLAGGVALGAGGLGAAAITGLGRGGGSLGGSGSRSSSSVRLGSSSTKGTPGTLGRGSGLLPGQAAGQSTGRQPGRQAGQQAGQGRGRNGLLPGQSGARGAGKGRDQDGRHDGYDDPDGWLEDDVTTDGVLD